MELPDREICYRALQTRDPRFDGLLFVGVSSTRVYCRPVCPARTPQLQYCRFFGSAAAAQAARFRPCLRCRPETAPDLASWRGTANTVSRALALIAEGALDGDRTNVARLSERLGVGERQLRRLFLRHLGASPIAVAQTRRVLFAKQLIHETRMPMTDVALAAGFGSVRRFNEVFKKLFRRPPSALRRESSAASPIETDITLRIAYRPPYDWESILAYLQARAIPGIEVIENGLYERTVETDGCVGCVQVANLPQHQSLSVKIRFSNVRSLPSIVTRVRRLFDTGADIEAIDEHLSSDPLLAPLVAQRPGLRALGGWDGFELAVRAVLGQQVSVAAARRLAGQLVARHGRRMSAGYFNHSALSYVFPSADTIANARTLELDMPAARLGTVKALARAAVANPQLFQAVGTKEDAIARFRSIPGIGEWTAQYIAMRALRETDAFPASDTGLLRGVRLIAGVEPSPRNLLNKAESWRPWRAYAAQHIWAAEVTSNSTARST